MARRGRGALRIIGGRWRNTRIPLLAAAGLRPTGERVRETLFNWLAPEIAGARCLDLFAGSGALAFEAASRGAAAVVCVEQNAVLADAMEALKARLGAEAVTIQRDDALRWLAHNDADFDVVFVDPPFGANLLMATLEQLATASRSAATAAGGARMLVYIERARDDAALPAGWQAVREGRTREVAYGLYRLSTEGTG